MRALQSSTVTVILAGHGLRTEISGREDSKHRLGFLRATGRLYRRLDGF